MKTPDEIKKGLECCAYGTCDGCPYADDGCATNREMIDALEYIHQLETRIDTLTAKAVLFDEVVAAGEKMKRERDAAVEQLRKVDKEDLFRCTHCKHDVRCPEILFECNECDNSECPCNICVDLSNWQWRGAEVV